ncbi:MAG: H-NS family nucleoid-associated regulatory protein [Sedimentitalea sp.]
MSRKELLKLGKDVEKALVEAEGRERAEALKAAEKAAADFGFSLGELAGKPSRKNAAPKAQSQAKYRNPENGNQTWSGRGRKPNWVHDALANGTDLATLEI